MSFFGLVVYERNKKKMMYEEGELIIAIREKSLFFFRFAIQTKNFMKNFFLDFFSAHAKFLNFKFLSFHA